MRRLIATAALAITSLLALASPAAAQEERTGDDNHAIAINTEDGGSVFRLALSVRMVTNGVVDQTNTAVALASCTDCQTVALAFQVVLVRGDAEVVMPVNQALAYNEQCTECVTYASATQIVLGFDGFVRLSGDGRRRMAELYLSLRELEERAAELTLVELNAEVQAAKQELIDILQTSLVLNPDPAPEATASDDSTTTTTTGEDPATTSTSEGATSTTGEPTTTTSSTSSTSTSAASSTTTTTTAP